MLGKICQPALRYEAPRPSVPASEAEWTVLVYQDTASSLRPSLEENFQALARTGSSERIRVAVQAGPSVDGSRVQRFEVSPGGGAQEVASFAGDQRGGGTLRDFVSWGMQSFPAKHTMLIVAGHGEGYRGVCTDGKNGGGMPLSTFSSALSEAVSAVGRPLDVLAFDACQMGQIEVLQALQGTAPVVIASQELIGPPGLPYAAIISDLKQFPERGPTEVAAAVVEQSRVDELARQSSGAVEAVYTLASFDMKQVPDFTARLTELSSALQDSSISPAVLRGAAQCTQGFNRGLPHPIDSDVRDAVGYALQLLTDESIEDEKVRGAARDLLRSAEKLILAEQHAGREERYAHGLSIYLPNGLPAVPPTEIQVYEF
jgi:hypothetical protein